MAKCYSSFAATAFLMFIVLQQCSLLAPVSSAAAESTSSTLLEKLAPDHVYFPDEIMAKRVEYDDFLDPISGEDEDEESYEVADYAVVSSEEEEDLSTANDTVIGYVLFPSPVEYVSH
ncbi:uncharacterized protein LOC105232373 [Bactrocera dorsalis]|uniref:Uncharacterized protein LOC105232373 n=1 Tax=Bactrocera dorsalis TaxID=27457 RepID=A0A6I9VM88_BACDO|nr:uncharacterized protein LOC105232373 [Bactrocera dorsalis]